jgi:hypothetical protein
LMFNVCRDTHDFDARVLKYYHANHVSNAESLLG